MTRSGEDSNAQTEQFVKKLLYQMIRQTSQDISSSAHVINNLHRRHKQQTMTSYVKLTISTSLNLLLKGKTQHFLSFLNIIVHKFRHQGVNLNLCGSAEASKVCPLGALGLF